MSTAKFSITWDVDASLATGITWLTTSHMQSGFKLKMHFCNLVGIHFMSTYSKIMDGHKSFIFSNNPTEFRKNDVT